MEENVKPLYLLEAHKGTVVSIVQPFQGSDFILTLSNDKFVLLWNLSLGNLINEISNDAAPTKLFVFSKLGFLFIPKWNNSFSLIDLSIFNLYTKHIIDINFFENEINFVGHKSWVLHAIELEEEDKFLTCGRDHTICLWNILSTRCELILSEHKENVNYIIQLEEALIASCSSDNTIKVWNIKKNIPLNSSKISIYDGDLPVFQIEKLKDNCLVSRNESPTMKIWDYLSGKLIRVLEDHYTNVICMKVLKNYKILSGSYDHTAKIWNKDKDKPEITLSGHEFTVFSVAECKNGNILTASGDGTIKLWDIKKQKCLQTFIGHKDYVVTLLNTKNNEFVSGSYDYTAIIWKIKAS
jgi:WD40 repeat protein